MVYGPTQCMCAESQSTEARNGLNATSYNESITGFLTNQDCTFGIFSNCWKCGIYATFYARGSCSIAIYKHQPMKIIEDYTFLNDRFHIPNLFLLLLSA